MQQTDFEQALAATLRALAKSPAIEVSFAGETTTVAGDRVRLAASTTQAIAICRGHADAAACRLRYHDSTILRRYAPAGGNARALYEQFEQIRCEILGSRQHAGVAANLQNIVAEQCQQIAASGLRDWQIALTDILPLLLREQLSTTPLPTEIRFILSRWRSHPVVTELNRLTSSLDDQAAFAQESTSLLAELGISDQDDAEQPITQQTVMLEQDSDDEINNEENKEDAKPEQQLLDRVTGAPWYPEQEDITTSVYQAYTTEFDEHIEAEELCSAPELARLRGLLDEQLQPLQNLISRLANRLQRHLLAQQERAWEFELDEGLLDTRRLPQVVMNPLTPLAFKREKVSPFRDTIVTLLIDNSRSMRGWPINIAALSADILARTLERCAVGVEILGFTTRSWKYGQSGEHWQAAGKPANPGRLNDLRHIIYKTADVPWRHAKNNLGLMMRVDILKQNVDGEALLWAHQRLLQRPEQRRILIMISDGVPIDEFTLVANSPAILDRHLRQVIAWIEQQSPVQLAAIGIGHDVTRYYRQATMIETAEQFSSVLINQLDDLFSRR